MPANGRIFFASLGRQICIGYVFEAPFRWCEIVCLLERSRISQKSDVQTIT
jgi:hypothetical protein